MVKVKTSKNHSDKKNKHTYAQVLFRNIKDVLKIKDRFPNLSNKKIENIHKTINDTGKLKPHINMTVTNSKP